VKPPSSPVRRVLFVDDDSAVLGMLRVIFQRLGGEWDLAFAGGGEEALGLMQDRAFDLVVSDMRMPGINGVELLTEVRERQPQAARVILSGYADQHLVMRSLGVAHQFVAKPFDLPVFHAVVRRLMSLPDLLGNEHLRVIEARIQTLPSLPALYSELMEELASAEATTDSVGDLIAQDLGLTAKLLQLVNSAFFGVAQSVNSAREAVQILGFSLVRTLALSIYVFSRFDPATMPGFPIERLWRHSLATGMLARRIANKSGLGADQVEAAFTAGMLHDIGKLALVFSLPDLHRSAVENAVRQSIPTCDAEKAVIGSSHAEVGAYLLGLWGLPAELVDTTAWHHRPREREPVELCPLTAVHMAEYIQTRRTPLWDPAPPASVDHEYLKMLDMDQQLTKLTAEDDAA
jgi:putative nucleotidyltransferase with HDIG domain